MVTPFLLSVYRQVRSAQHTNLLGIPMRARLLLVRRLQNHWQANLVFENTK